MASNHANLLWRDLLAFWRILNGEQIGNPVRY
jgi:hypothetical protein